LGRLQQETDALASQLTEAQTQQEATRVELAATVEQLAEAQEQLADVQAQFAAARHRVAIADENTAQLEKALLETGKMEQELRVGQALIAEAQTQQETTRVELAATVEQLTDARAQLADVQSQLESAGHRAAAADENSAQLEKVLLETGKLEQELRVGQALMAEAQTQQETTRVELASTVEQLTDARTQLADAQSQLESAGHRAAAADENSAQLEKSLLETGKLEQELRVREALMAEAQTQQETARVELASTVEQLTDAPQLADAQSQLESADHRAAADANSAQLEKALLETGKLEQELRVGQALIAEAQTQQETARVELASTVEQLNQVQAQLAAARQGQDELRQAAEAAGAATEAAASSALDRDDESSRLREAIATAHTENERLAGQLQDAQSEEGVDTAELDELRCRCSGLEKKLATTEQQLADAGEHESDAQASEDQRRRFEMAVEELRDLKRVNAELEAKLASGSGIAVSTASTGLDWEAQKQRMLASLEADDIDEDDEDAVAERQSIEGTIHITDQIVNQKDAEIDKLKRQLEESTGGAEASDPKAIAELLDSDEIIRQEREKLVQAQAEWRKKIGQAEIEISLERAKIGRERTVLEEKERLYQADQSSRSNSDTPDAPPEKPPRGRWLSRLGLKDLNES